MLEAGHESCCRMPITPLPILQRDQFIFVDIVPFVLGEAVDEDGPSIPLKSADRIRIDAEAGGSGAPGETRTPDLLVRSQTLYPTELRARAMLMVTDMSIQGQTIETEIKLRLKDAADGTRRLTEAGFAIVKPRIFEANTVFDTPDLSLRSRNSLLRLRQAGDLSIVTYKGPSVEGKHKTREELEFEVSDSGMCAEVIARIGFQKVFRYEKYRTEYRCGHSTGRAMLDETAIGTFLELEGTPDWIDQQAIRLGFTEQEYITASYGRLYLDYCVGTGKTPGDMLVLS